MSGGRRRLEKVMASAPAGRVCLVPPKPTATVSQAKASDVSPSHDTPGTSGMPRCAR
jgi:hypothetical protein